MLFPFHTDGLVLSLVVKTAYILVIYAAMMLLSREFKLFNLQ